MAKKIGDVFVKVHFRSDGKELREDVQKDPEFEKAGEAAAEQEGEGYNNEWIKQLEERVKNDEAFQKRREAALKGWETRRANIAKAATEEIQKADDNWFRNFRNGMKKVDEDYRKTGRSTSGFLGVLHKIGDASDDVGDSVGRAFGKGSRNDFINFFGSFVGNLAALPGMLVEFGANVGDTFKRVQKAFAESETLAEGLGTAFAELGPAAAAAIAGGLIALPFILGLVSSAVMLLTGAVIALAGALTFALVGAIGAVAGALVPLAAGIGVAILAFKGMTKEQKAAFSGVGDEFNKLSKVAAAHLFKNAAADGKEFSKVVDSLLPIVAGVANALRDVGEGFLHAMSGPGAKKFIEFLSNVLPGMIRTIGRIALNLGAFLGEAFVAVTPLVREFLGWLAGVTQGLADMGKGGKKSKLAEFFSNVQPIMDQVGGAIEQVAGLIADLFGAGAKTGGDMFQSLADNVQKFRDFLQKAKKDGSLQKFFDDAKKFGDALGEAVVQVGKLIAALDTPEGRKALLFMLRTFTSIVRQITDFVNLEAELLHRIVGIGQAIGRWFGKRWHDIPKVWHAMVEGARNAWNAIKNAFGNIGGWFAARWHAVTNAAKAAWNAIKSAAASAKEWVQSRWEALVNWFKGLPGRLTNAGNWASVGRTIGEAIFHAVINALTGLPGQIVQLFAGLGSRIVSAIGAIAPHINWPDPPGWLKKVVPGMATGGVVFHETLARIGEAGPEAIVPLNRPLSQVDPAVRALSAFAQGKDGTTSVTGRGGKSVTTGPITIITPVKDPAAVAQQVVNRLAAASYI